MVRTVSRCTSHTYGRTAPSPEGRSRGCIGRKDGMKGDTGRHGDGEEPKDDESHCKQHESQSD